MDAPNFLKIIHNIFFSWFPKYVEIPLFGTVSYQVQPYVYFYAFYSQLIKVIVLHVTDLLFPLVRLTVGVPFPLIFVLGSSV